MSFEMIIFILQTLLLFKSYSISTKYFSNATIRIFKITLFFRLFQPTVPPSMSTTTLLLEKKKGNETCSDLTMTKILAQLRMEMQQTL